jgi:hypothetical protein
MRESLHKRYTAVQAAAVSAANPCSNLNQSLVLFMWGLSGLISDREQKTSQGGTKLTPKKNIVQ